MSVHLAGCRHLGHRTLQGAELNSAVKAAWSFYKMGCRPLWEVTLVDFVVALDQEELSAVITELRKGRSPGQSHQQFGVLLG